MSSAAGARATRAMDIACKAMPLRRAALIAGASIIALSIGTPVLAQNGGGQGGKGFVGTNGGAGGSGPNGEAGQDGVNGTNTGGGGGGGAGTTGGAGGAGGGGGGAGGAGGTAPGGDGAAGGSSSGDLGAGGGGGGAHGGIFNVGSLGASVGGSFTGGTGGAGGIQTNIFENGGGGGGGEGGYGLLFSGSDAPVFISDSAVGGSGGKGGNSAGGEGGAGGSGGIGVYVNGTGMTLFNGGVIAGGSGGAGSTGFTGGLPGGSGGVGVVGASLTVYNEGSISGGLSGDGLTRANAVTFGAGTNTFVTLLTATVTGNVVGDGDDAFIIDNAGSDGAFAVSQFGSTYQGFGSFTKGGFGTATLTGTTTQLTPWTIQSSTLAIANDAALGDPAGAVTFSSRFSNVFRTLRFDANISSGRNYILTGAGWFEVGGGLNASISGLISGAAPLIKTGAGTLTLTGNNTFIGGLSLSAGTLVIGNDGALGTGLLGPGDGTTVGYIGDRTIPNAVALFGGVTFATGANSVTHSGVISGTGNLVKNGTGMLTLSGNNTFSGGASLASGTLVLGNNAALGTGPLSAADGTMLGYIGNRTIANAIALGGGVAFDTGANSVTHSGVISGTGNLVKKGSGALTLSGDNTFSGGASLASGTLVLGNNAALGTGALTAAGGTTLGYIGNRTIANAVALGGAVTFDTGTNSITHSGIISGTGPLAKTGTGSLSLTGNNTYSGGTNLTGGKLVLGHDLALGTGALTANDGTTLGYNGDRTIANAIAIVGGIAFDTGTNTITHSGVISGAGSLNKVGTGTLTLTNNSSSYTLGTYLNAGTLILGNDLVLGSGALFAADGTSLGYIGNRAIANAVTLNGAVTVDTGGGSITHSGTISGTGSLTKTGAGTLTLANNFSGYSGGTFLNAGTLVLGNDFALGGGALTAADGTTLGFIGNRNMANATSLSGNVTFDTGDNFIFHHNVISGIGSLSKTGIGRLVLSGNNTYSGGTNLNGGTLFLANDNALGTGALTAAGGTTLRYFGNRTIANAVALGGAVTFATDANNITHGGVISGAGSLTKSGSGALTLTGVNTYSGGTSLTGGTLVLGNDAVLSTGALTAAGGTTLGYIGNRMIANAVALGGAVTFDTGANSIIHTGLISGTGALTKTGSGTLTLIGSNTFSGDTFVNVGTLILGADNALSDGTDVVISSRATFDLGAFSDTVGSVALSGTLGGTGTLTAASYALTGGTVNANLGAGTLTSNGTSSLNGTSGAATVNVNGGTLTLGAANRLADTAVLTIATRATFDLGAFSDTVGSLALSGTLGGTGTLTAASYALTGGTVNANLGAGTLTSNGTSSLNGTSGAATVNVNGGTLTLGAADRLADAATVVVANSSTLALGGDETVSVLAGGGTVALGANRLTLTNGGLLLGNTSGTGGITSQAGLLVVGSAQGNTGLTRIDGGSALFGGGGSLAGGFSLASGTSLAGTGVIGGTLTIAGGAEFSPGTTTSAYGVFDVGAMNTAGNITVDFGGNSTGSMSDLIKVAGAVNVTGGRIIARPTSAASDYTFNQYFAITAGTTFTGQFENPTGFTPNALNPLLLERIRYDLGPRAVLEVRRLQDFTVNVPLTGVGNARNVAFAINGTQFAADDAFAGLINALVDLPPSELAGALSQLSGESNVTGTQASIAAFSGFLGTMMGRGPGSGGQRSGNLVYGGNNTRVARIARTVENYSALGSNGESGFGTWAEAYLIDQSIGATGGFASAQTDGGGLAFGADYRFNDVAVGVAVGYAEPETGIASRRARASAETFGIGAYASAQSGGLSASIAFGYTSSDVETRRSAFVGPLGFSPSGETDSETFGFEAQVQYGFDVGNGLMIGPRATGIYSDTEVDAYSETGGGVANLAFSAIEAQRFVGTGEMFASQTIRIGTVDFTPMIRGGIAYAKGDRDFVGTGTFTRAPAGTGSFLTRGVPLPETWAVFGSEIRITDTASPLSVGVSYEGAKGDGFEENSFAINVGLRF